MITLSVLDVKSKKVKEETFFSKDKAERRLDEISASPNKWRLKGASYDTSSEKELADSYLFPKKEEES